MLTPVDIENADFKRVARGKGYDCDEVDDFLDLVIVEFEKLINENTRLKDKITVLNEAMQHYKDMEETLKASIVTGEKTAEDTRQNAKAEAEQILAEAKNMATEIIGRANNEKYKIEVATSNLKGRYTALQAKMKTLLTSELELLDNAAEEFK